MKSAYEFMRKTWGSTELQKAVKNRLIAFRQQHTVERVDRPTRLDRARAVGYRAKQGYAVARVRVVRGGRRRRLYGRRGRKQSKAGLVHFTFGKSLQWQAEEKAQRRFVNMEVLNSYPVAQDGRHRWFEVILVDPSHPNIKNDPKISWVTNPANKHRVFRGLTSAAKHSMQD